MEDRINSEVRAAIIAARSQMSAPDSTVGVLVAVSGGVDSHVLLHVLANLASELNLELYIAHVNHGLRIESDDEARFVQKLGDRYGYPVVVYNAEALPKGQNMEAWARGVRYEFFERCRIEHSLDIIATAHNLNDQGETLLMRLISSRFATDSRCIAQFDTRRHLVRPLLSVSRQMIEDYAALHRLTFVTDKSNMDTTRMRNYVRHKLIPVLAALNPSLLRGLALSAERQSEDEKQLWREAEDSFNQRGDDRFSASFVASLPKSLSWRVAKLIALENIGGCAEYLGFAALKQATYIANKEQGGADLGFKIRCFVDNSNNLCFSLGPKEKAEGFTKTDKSAQLSVPGRVDWPVFDGNIAAVTACILNSGQWEFSQVLLESRDGGGSVKERAVCYFDVRYIDASGLIVRARRAGDSVRVWQRGSRKLKKLFQEQGVTLTVRACLPIVELCGKILWVPGVARSDFAVVDETTESLVRLTYEFCGK